MAFFLNLISHATAIEITHATCVPLTILTLRIVLLTWPRVVQLDHN